MEISIIVPTYNEEIVIGDLLNFIETEIRGHQVEIIISDAGSTDNTAKEITSRTARFIISPKRGRAAQMNHGATKAIGDVFYFLHADSIPPRGFLLDIKQAISQGHLSGCYRLRFDNKHWFLKASAWFTRFNVNCFRFGDQSLFVSRDLFHELKGYEEDHIVLEDQEIIYRLKARTKFKVIPRYITTSARKYLQNNPYRLQYVFFRIWLNYYFGKPQEQLIKLYKRLIKNHKIQENDAT